MEAEKKDLKRRDRKGRILRNGESQRKDGRYAYVYSDLKGKQRFIYSWKLEPTDALPAGARQCRSLREKKKDILKKLEEGLDIAGGDMTVLELVERYIATKTGVRDSTIAGYRTVIGILKKENAFSSRKIARVKQMEAKEWIIGLQAAGRSYSSIHCIRGVVRPAFQMALDNDLIRKNPFEFPLCTVVVNDSVMREAVTKKQMRTYLDFVKNDEHFSRYYEAIYILFHTGLRISEFTGLRKSDIDFEKNLIRVDHQLIRNFRMEYKIEDTKTPSGVRFLPMTEEVRNCFRIIIERRKKIKSEPFVTDRNGNAYYGFLFLDKNRMPMISLHWQKYFQHIIEKYNKIYKQELPRITPHVCRHTYCSNMARSGMNPKTLQYLMGHSEIGVTLNVYTHLNYEDAQKELLRLEEEAKTMEKSG